MKSNFIWCRNLFIFCNVYLFSLNSSLIKTFNYAICKIRTSMGGYTVTGHGFHETHKKNLNKPTIPRAICHAKDIASVGWNVSQSLSHSFSSVFGAAFSSWIDDQNTVIGILHWSSSSKSHSSPCSFLPSWVLEGPPLASELFGVSSTRSVS